MKWKKEEDSPAPGGNRTQNLYDMRHVVSHCATTNAPHNSKLLEHQHCNIFPKIGHLWIFLDSEQERLEPANGGLDVRVEEDQDVGGRGSNPGHATPHQTLALLLPQKFDFAAELRVVLDVVVQSRALTIQIF